MAETAVSLDDHAFIDGLWADWSPGYDADWDVARVKESIGAPENLTAAIGYYRAMFDPALHDAAYADAQTATAGTPPQPTLYLHGADDGCLAIDGVGDVLPFLSPGSEQVTVARSGHFLQVERPDAVNDHILRFIGAPGRDLRKHHHAAGAPAGETLRDEGVGHPAGPPGVVGPAAGGGQTAGRDRSHPEGGHQPAPALAIGTGEHALRGPGCGGIGLGSPGAGPGAGPGQGTTAARRGTGRADEGADLHERLVPHPAPARWHQGVGHGLGLRRGEGIAHHGAGEDPGHVHVDDGVVGLEGEGENGASRIGPRLRAAPGGRPDRRGRLRRGGRP